MTAVFISTTLAVIGYSLWVRRDTWWSRWERAATLAVALEGFSLVLLSPWAGTELSPALYRWLGAWNVQQLLGSFCMIAAIVANIYHMLVRLTDPDTVLRIMGKHLQVPLGVGSLVMLAAVVGTDRDFEPDMFARLTGDGWLTVYELAAVGIALYLSCYVSKLLLLLRHDSRARTTVNLYLASMVFAVAACVIVAGSIWVGGYAGTAIWACICVSIGIFAYGLARSWRAKTAWFASDASAPR